MASVSHVCFPQLIEEDASLASGSVIMKFPLLRGLGLAEDDLAALRGQGFISCERRRAEHAPIYKLRYRTDGRQRTRYLGTDLSIVDSVRCELAELQKSVKDDRKMRQVLRFVRRRLRHCQKLLAPLLAQGGYTFHGRVLRRRRRQVGERPPAP